MQALLRYRDLILPIAIIACLLVIIVPLPPAWMDVLLACNITISVIVLLTTIQVKTPLEFSVFPALLLATTLGRLVLNIATTRLILTSADQQGMSAAGGVIQAFGEFVAGDQIAVGLIIFAIIMLVQFVVITKGSARISEVAARFALDGLPGRQMAIDADLNAGLIDEKEAQSRRADVRAQADFYGAMDGASKYVRGDAIAGIAITAVNIIGGLYIGVVQSGMPVGEAANVFTKLTVGDGLASQVPALLISLSVGLLVTRSSEKTNLPTQFLQQLFGDSRALIIAGCFLLLLIGTDLPTIPLAVLGIGCIGLSISLNKQEAHKEKTRLETEQANQDAPTVRRVEDFLLVDPMELSIGLGLLGLADPERGGHLMQRIADTRNSLAADIGIVLPKVRVHDDVKLGPLEYEIRLSGNRIAKAIVRPDQILAVDAGRTTGTISGSPAGDTPYGLPAYWIAQDAAEQAAIFGYQIYSPVDVVISQLEEVSRRHADELLTQDATKHLVDELSATTPVIVDALIPEIMSLNHLRSVLQQLLREDIPIRQLAAIMETLTDVASHTNNSAERCELVRQKLARTISSRFRDEAGVLHVLTLDPAIEQNLSANVEHAETNLISQFNPEWRDSTCKRIQEAAKKLVAEGYPPVVLVSAGLRSVVRQMTEPTMPWLKILSYREVTRDTKIQAHGVVQTVEYQPAMSA